MMKHKTNNNDNNDDEDQLSLDVLFPGIILP